VNAGSKMLAQFLSKLGYGDLVLGSSQLLILPQLPQKDASFKSGQAKLQNNHLASIV